MCFIDFVFFYLDEHSLTSMYKNQILELAIDLRKYEKLCSTSDMNARIFAHIFTMFSNLQYLNFCPSLIRDQRLSFDNLSSAINSSSLLELHIRLVRFTDCLYILNERFNKLHTFYVDIDSISSSDLTNNNQVDYFG